MSKCENIKGLRQRCTCVKLAPRFLVPQDLTLVLFAPVIVLQFLISYINSSYFDRILFLTIGCGAVIKNRLTIFKEQNSV